jgi:hypothetical protein
MPGAPLLGVRDLTKLFSKKKKNERSDATRRGFTHPKLPLIVYTDAPAQRMPVQRGIVVVRSLVQRSLDNVHFSIPVKDFVEGPKYPSPAGCRVIRYDHKKKPIDARITHL